MNATNSFFPTHLYPREQYLPCHSGPVSEQPGDGGGQGGSAFVTDANALEHGLREGTIIKARTLTINTGPGFSTIAS